MIELSEISCFFDYQAGVCAFESVKEYLLPCRNLQKIPENARSVIVFIFPYKIKEEKPKNICRYAAVPDYHKICGNILEEYALKLACKYPQNHFQPFIDNSPIPEVYAAAKAGLGVAGKNGLLITKQYGSYVFIGEIITDLEIEVKNCEDCCLNCNLCEKACPVGLNKEQCLSALTQKKGELAESEVTLIKNSGCVWGCDICAEVCPMNKGKGNTNIEEFIDGYRDEYRLGEDITGRAYAWRGAKIINRNLNIVYDK